MERWKDDVTVSLSYFVIALCIVFPPTEFVNAGLTIQTVYSSWLGSEQLDFVGYHIRRTIATIVVHASLPLGYFLAMAIFTSHDSIELYKYISAPAHDSTAVLVTAAIAASVVACLAALAIAHSWLNGNHPIVKQLKRYNPENWKRIASEISAELLRIDKFETGPPNRRLIVTDSWLLLTTAYNVYFAKKIDVNLRLKGSLDLAVHPDFGQQGIQFLDIDVIDVSHSSEKLLFSVRLSSLELNELQTRVASPIENVRNVVIRQSLSDRFVAAFLDQIDSNPRHRLPQGSPDIESCIGCMQHQANVKLKLLCDGLGSETDERRCQQCFCRPMWCAECLGRWFAARQDQHDPSTWMAHKCPCPTCRSVFCVLDICYIDDE